MFDRVKVIKWAVPEGHWSEGVEIKRDGTRVPYREWSGPIVNGEFKIRGGALIAAPGLMADEERRAEFATREEAEAAAKALAAAAPQFDFVRVANVRHIKKDWRGQDVGFRCGAYYVIALYSGRFGIMFDEWYNSSDETQYPCGYTNADEVRADFARHGWRG